MQVTGTFSHFNGLEHLLVHNESVWNETQNCIRSAAFKGNSPSMVAEELDLLLEPRGWKVECRKTVNPKATLVGYRKDRLLLEIHCSESPPNTCEVFGTPLALFVQDEIDIGIEILATKSMQEPMSSGPGCCEGGLYNVIRNGRGVPAVPLVLIGIAP